MDCPKCGNKLRNKGKYKGDAVLWCSNDDCDVKTMKVDYDEYFANEKTKPRIIEKQGKRERKNKYEVLKNNNYRVYYGNEFIDITEEQLSKARKLYSISKCTIEQVCTDMDWLREEFFAIKTAFSFVKTSIPFTDNELSELSVDEMVDKTITEKKRSYFKNLKEIENKILREELKKYKEKDYFISKVLEELNTIDINVNINTTLTLDTDKHNNERVLVVPIADTHSGLIVDSQFGKYNISIMRDRFEHLTKEIIIFGVDNGISKIYLNELGDTVSGFIHDSVRKHSIDLITSYKEVISCWVNMLTSLSYVFDEIIVSKINGSHSSLEKSKQSRTNDENIGNLFSWCLSGFLKNNNKIIFNPSTNNMATITPFGTYTIAMLHGDQTGWSQLSRIERMFRDLKITEIHTGHYHHSKSEDFNGTKIISFKSICSTDEYASNLLLGSEPGTELRIYNKKGIDLIKNISFV